MYLYWIHICAHPVRLWMSARCPATATERVCRDNDKLQVIRNHDCENVRVCDSIWQWEHRQLVHAPQREREFWHSFSSLPCLLGTGFGWWIEQPYRRLQSPSQHDWGLGKRLDVRPVRAIKWGGEASASPPFFCVPTPRSVCARTPCTQGRQVPMFEYTVTARSLRLVGYGAPSSSCTPIIGWCGYIHIEYTFLLIM